MANPSLMTASVHPRPRESTPIARMRQSIGVIPFLNALLIAIVLLALAAPRVGAATPTAPAVGATARIVATDAANVRACPAITCAVLAVAALHTEVTVTGAPVSSFVPVRTRGVDGFVHAMYLSAANPDPWFTGGEQGCKRVALIFNIGVGDTPSQTVLDTLIAEDADATMFAMGNWAETHRDYLRQLRDAGFTIGTHGYAPTYLTNLTDDEIRADLKASVDAISSITGQPVATWATPYAAATDARVRAIVAEMGYMPVGWAVTAADFGPDATAEGVIDRVLPNVTDGAIVEFHLDGPATESSTAMALPVIIASLRDQGYDLVSVPDLAMPCATRS
ncbi:MAG: polysaccharide deacetylase family protein [Thermomicrobiales bacterium]